jgi:uncharacterized membrane protein (UPF0182 family)
LYIQAERVKIPELKRVIMYAGGQVAMGTSVEDALNRLVGWVAEPPSGESEPGEITGLPDLIARANEVWSEAQARLRSGDWAGYGELIEELGEILRQLQRHSTGLEQ